MSSTSSAVCGKGTGRSPRHSWSNGIQARLRAQLAFGAPRGSIRRRGEPTCCSRASRMSSWGTEIALSCSSWRNSVSSVAGSAPLARPADAAIRRCPVRRRARVFGQFAAAAGSVRPTRRTHRDRRRARGRPRRNRAARRQERRGPPGGWLRTIPRTSPRPIGAPDRNRQRQDMA
jgi:hypothetical protein